VAADPDENIENGLKIMANIMAKFLAIIQHNFQSHERWSPLESLRLENHFGEDGNTYGPEAMEDLMLRCSLDSGSIIKVNQETMDSPTWISNQ
jgi:hypothetical protein